jgi:hypothetical protein
MQNCFNVSMIRSKLPWVFIQQQTIYFKLKVTHPLSSGQLSFFDAMNSTNLITAQSEKRQTLNLATAELSEQYLKTEKIP